jgi:TonB family protein
MDTDKLLSLGQDEITLNPAVRRVRTEAIAATVALYLIILAAIIFIPWHKPVRVTVSHPGSIGAFVNVTTSVPAGAAASPRPAARPRPAPKAPVEAPEMLAASTAEMPGEQAQAVGTQGTGPTRLSLGQVQLIKKVEPVYPPLMITSRQDGTVVLDAIINPDGTIGDITVLQSLNALFDRAAVNAVRQWRYSPIGFQAVVTVTVKFNLR